MRRNLPTFTSLTCFEASARHLNFTRAGEELNLSQSAVSRQVQNLENFLDTPLFERIKKRLTLTADGATYAKFVTNHLNQLETETLKLITKDQNHTVLNLGTFPTFGSRWLIPKLADFTKDHPELQVNFTTGLVPFDFNQQDIDIAFQHGDGNWPDCHCLKLIDEEVVAACAPGLISQSETITAETVLNHTLLHLKTRTYAWPEWLREKGLQPSLHIPGPQFETFSYMIRAALCGLGIAIVPPMYIEEELKDGRLISPFGAPVKTNKGYYLVTSNTKLDLERVKTFSTWISKQVISKKM